MEQKKTDRIITIKNGKNITLNGVNHIIGFDEKCIILSCDFGKIIVEGMDLKIESLLKENGEISVFGNVKGVYLTDENKTESKIKRFFKW